jgi:hemerythrin-like domain-containing protein
MYAMHYAFRRDITDLVEAARRTPADDLAAWGRLRDYWLFFVGMLHHHHAAEDECYWPRLAEDVRARGTAADLAIVKAMKAEHEALDASLHACAAHFDAVAAGPRSADVEELCTKLAELRAVLDEHMGHEEREALPLVQRVMTPDTYRQIEKAIGKTYSLRHAFALAAWALYGVAPEVRREFTPVPQRILYRLTHRRFERRHRAAMGVAGAVGAAGRTPQVMEASCTRCAESECGPS